ncbi:MAG: response regulator [Acidobacteria bacterium]|nr:response regulator [Acidobacteriota bacterium]
MSKRPRVLVVNESPEHNQILTADLEQAGYETRFQPAEEVRAGLLPKGDWDVVLCCDCIPDFSALDTLNSETARRLPLLSISKVGAEFVAVRPARSGVQEGLLSESLPDLVSTYLKRSACENAHAQRSEGQANETLQAVLNAAPVAIYVLDLQGHVQTWSQSAERLFGWTEQEAIGRALPTVPDDQVEQLQSILARYRGGENLIHAETRRIRKDGALIHAAAWSAALRAPDGSLTGIVVVAADVSEQRRLEQQLQQAQKMEAVGRLAGGVAHDFNNLLTVITGYGQLLLHQLPAGDQAREPVDAIVKAADRAGALTKQLLAFSRRQAIQPRVLDLNESVTQLQSMLCRVIREDIRLSISLSADLGRVKADPGQIDQVLMNLAVNSRDAMPRGGSLRIETRNVELDEAFARRHSGVAAGPYVVLEVSDTGAGMDAATRARVFEPFFTTKETGQGAGLGLATVYGIVTQSCGHITVDSEPDKGTTFKIYLPRTSETPVEQEAAAKGPSPRGSETILLVEDDATVRSLLAGVLEQLGYTVLVAEGGLDALLLSEEYAAPIHLLLTDMVMPGSSGDELAATLARVRAPMRVICMSGYTDGAFPLRPGAAFLPKPFTPDTLARKLRDVLDARPSGSTILVVDDDPDARKVIRLALEEAGHRVVEAADGRQALRALGSERIDLLITDLVMPEQEGLAVITQLRQEQPGLKIIAVSGAMGLYLDMAQKLGAHAAMSKPVKLDELLDTVQRLTAR